MVLYRSEISCWLWSKNTNPRPTANWKPWMNVFASFCLSVRPTIGPSVCRFCNERVENWLFSWPTTKNCAPSFPWQLGSLSFQSLPNVCFLRSYVDFPSYFLKRQFLFIQRVQMLSTGYMFPMFLTSESAIDTRFSFRLVTSCQVHMHPRITSAKNSARQSTSSHHIRIDWKYMGNQKGYSVFNCACGLTVYSIWFPPCTSIKSGIIFHFALAKRGRERDENTCILFHYAKRNQRKTTLFVEW